MENEKNLKSISDEEQVLLTKLSYLDFDIEKFEKLKFDGKKVTISDLEKLLVNPNSSYLKISETKRRECLGDIKLSTQLEVIQELKEKGLGDFSVIDIASDPQITFKAIAFEDEKKNRGMAYSGTDFRAISKDADDNLPNHLKESQEQIEAAKYFFENNSDKSDYNYIYGHSLGGNMVNNIYIENSKKIRKAFTVNALPVNHEKLEDDDKMAALWDDDKYQCYVIGGDCANELESEKEYELCIRYVKNMLPINEAPPAKYNNLLCCHILEGASYDDEGEFIYGIDNYKDITYHGRKYKQKEDKIEEPKKKSNFIFKEDQIDYAYEAIDKMFKTFEELSEKVVNFSKSALEKLKEIGRKIFPQDTKLLTDGSEKKKQENSRESFVEGLKIDKSILEKAIEEQKEAGNPVLDKTTEENKVTSTEEKGQEIGE